MENYYRLFISHSWTYSDAYDKVISMIDAEDIKYYNHSVPINNPVHTNGTDYQLEEAIDAKMRSASCIIILAGVYSTHSKWINKEIAIAKKYNKPIIAIEPWASERTSKTVKDNATIVVKWQSKSIGDAIKSYSI
jgi:hypothetical protein